jgi:hypothetical protein
MLAAMCIRSSFTFVDGHRRPPVFDSNLAQGCLQSECSLESFALSWKSKLTFHHNKFHHTNSILRTSMKVTFKLFITSFTRLQMIVAERNVAWEAKPHSAADHGALAPAPCKFCTDVAPTVAEELSPSSLRPRNGF